MIRLSGNRRLIRPKRNYSDAGTSPVNPFSSSPCKPNPVTPSKKMNKREFEQRVIINRDTCPIKKLRLPPRPLATVNSTNVSRRLIVGGEINKIYICNIINFFLWLLCIILYTNIIQSSKYCYYYKNLIYRFNKCLVH